MIRSPIGLRLTGETEDGWALRERIQEAARLGAKGIVVDAIGELSPARLSDTGRRDLRHVLRTAELKLIALHLPTKRPFDMLEGFEDRLAKADAAFELAYDLGARLVLARVGAVPDASQEERRAAFEHALGELGLRADRRGVRLAIETGPDSGETLQAWFEQAERGGLAVSLDPGALLQHGHDPIAATVALGEVVAHAYARDGTGGHRPTRTPNPRGFGFAPGVLDWDEYLGALEEIRYAGFLTIWPDESRPVADQFEAISKRLSMF